MAITQCLILGRLPAIVVKPWRHTGVWQNRMDWGCVILTMRPRRCMYSTHRRVFDSNTDTLMLAADMPVSVRAASRAAISAKRSRNSDIRDMLLKRKL